MAGLTFRTSKSYNDVETLSNLFVRIITLDPCSVDLLSREKLQDK